MDLLLSYHFLPAVFFFPEIHEDELNFHGQEYRRSGAVLEQLRISKLNAVGFAKMISKRIPREQVEDLRINRRNIQQRKLEIRSG